jgi:tetratricopeptide (TPR) repeat protein
LHLLLLGGARDERIARARLHASPAAVALDAAVLPFIRPAPALFGGARTPRVVRIDDVERAFPNRQTGGIRLVLTQSTYLVQKWIDLLDPDDSIILTADRAALERCAEEAFAGRGPWATFEIIDLDNDTKETKETKETRAKPDFSFRPALSSVTNERAVERLVRAFGSPSADERVRLCREATALAPADAATWLALASACRERQDPAGARAALDRAIDLAPGWEAVDYEDGKFWLGADDMPRARAAFERAGHRMPAFSAAFSNLGATLGELDEPDAALEAFTRALAHDPRSATILNNIGVVARELGRLEDSEAAMRRVIALAPEFVFGHYNLGHTLFLAGKYPAALAAYEEGRRRDPEKNRRQGCRLAMMRFATGDLAGAERGLFASADAAPPGEREDLLIEAYEIAQALLAQHPDLAPQRPFLDRIAAAVPRL